MNASDTTKPPRLTAAQKRILALVAERPGLKFSFVATARSSYYWVWDDEDGLFQTRTSTPAVRGLIDAGLLPLTVLVASVGTTFRWGSGGLNYTRKVSTSESTRTAKVPCKLTPGMAFVFMDDEILAHADACSDYLTMTPSEIVNEIDQGDLGYDEDGQLTTRCRSCGNTSPDYTSPCSCH